MRELHPEFPAAYFGLKHIGLLRMGVGSALTRKLLARIEGPSPAPEDDGHTRDETYTEVTAADIASPDELAELAHDVGAQLGATNLRHACPVLEAQLRQTERAAVKRLGPRMRATAVRLVDELLASWESWRASVEPGRP